MPIDLRRASFDDWLRFVFDHEPVPENATGDARKEWYWSLDSMDGVVVDPSRQISYLRRLFERPTVLANFSPAQIDQGFWCMFGGWGDDTFRKQLWNRRVLWDERAAAIRAIEVLYRDLFALEEIGTSGFMLWDLLAYDYYSGRRSPETGFEDARVQQVMFETLDRMLLADSESTQLAALHGLHHLRHPECMETVRRFLAVPDRNQKVIEYAERVLERTPQ